TPWTRWGLWILRRSCKGVTNTDNKPEDAASTLVHQRTLQPLRGGTMAQRLLSRRTRGMLWGYFFIMPSMLAFLAFSLYPMFDSIILSFQRLRLTERQWVGFENYQRLLEEPALTKIFLNTFLYVLAIVPIGVLPSLTMATLIFRLPGILQTFYNSAFYLPVVTSGVVLGMVWLYLY